MPRPGFLRLLQNCLRICEGGCLHGGPPCSSWIWLNRGTSGRSLANPLGDLNEPSVRRSNTTLDLSSKLSACVVHNCAAWICSFAANALIDVFQLNCLSNCSCWTGVWTQDHGPVCLGMHPLYSSECLGFCGAAAFKPDEAHPVLQTHWRSTYWWSTSLVES